MEQKTFRKAVKHEAKLRLCIAGPSGSGKTYTGLRLGTALARGGRVALVDTEHGSASKYADLFNFDVLELEAPFHPERFVEAIKAAEAEEYSVVILDSLSHAWRGSGGLLDIVDQISKRMKSANTFAAWKDATPIQNDLIEGILGADLHVIATMRSRQEYVMDADEKGRTRVRKVGMAPVQRDGFEYEFDVFLDMDIDNNGIVSKTRCPALMGRVFNKPGEDVATILAQWLTGEAVPEQPTFPAANEAEPAPEPEPPAKDNGDPPAADTGGAFANAALAIAWGYEQGVFQAMPHAQNAYAALKTKKQPKTAAEMAALWRADVAERLVAKVADGMRQ